MYMTQEQDELLKKNGDYEANLMGSYDKLPLLKPTKIKIRKSPSSGGGGFGFGGGAGFGSASSSSSKSSSSKSSKQNKKIQNKNKQNQNQNSKQNQETTESKSSSTEILLQAQAQAYAKVLAEDGLVRIDNILPDSLVDDLKQYLVDLRARATNDIETGNIQDSQERFADVLLNQNRCDLKIPLGPDPVNNALHHLLTQTVLPYLISHVFESYNAHLTTTATATASASNAFGKQATLYELNCFMSNRGARRQLVHADNVCVRPIPEGMKPEEPVMLTTFVALQDTDATMGPTIFIPGTHNYQAHELFFDTTASTNNNNKNKEHILQSRQAVIGTLAKGSCVLFDPRVLHCAGANQCQDPNETRALFYFSFKNPKIEHPGCPSTGGYGIPSAEITLQQLARELQAYKDGDKQLVGHSRTLDMLSCNP